VYQAMRQVQGRCDYATANDAFAIASIGGFVAYGRSETNELCAKAIQRAPGPQTIAWEIEALHRKATESVIVLAIDDLAFSG
jgi:hypothetical protein